MRRLLGFVVAALWALSAAYAYGMVMLWAVGSEKFLAVLGPTLGAIAVLLTSRRAAGLLAPDSRVLALAFFLAAGLIASFINAANVYLVVAVAGLIWEGWRLWTLAKVMKPLVAQLGLEGAGPATMVHAMMIADTVGRMPKVPSKLAAKPSSERATRASRKGKTQLPGIFRHALRNRILIWMGAPRIPYRPEDWESK